MSKGYSNPTEFASRTVKQFLVDVMRERMNAMQSHGYFEHLVQQNQLSRAEADRERVELFEYGQRLRIIEDFVASRFPEATQ